MITVAVGLGSNLGNRFDHLDQALRHLAELGEITAVSRYYETAPVGPVEQERFLNAVAILETDLEAVDVMRKLSEFEQRQGRDRQERWGPRTLDLDLLLYGNATISSPGLVVPHPEMTTRRFVIEPLLEVWPDAALPDGTPIESFRAAVADQQVEVAGIVSAPDEGFWRRGGAWVIVQVILFLLYAYALAIAPELSFWWPFGLVLLAAGLAMLVAALGAHRFSVSPLPAPSDGRRLITSGIYGRVRHPIYGGVVLGALGGSLIFAGVWAEVVALVMGIFFYAKAGYEERGLLVHYTAYRRYMNRVPHRFYPRLF